MNPPFGAGRNIYTLPGSEDMVGGPHICMFFNIEDSPLDFKEWKAGSVYMHVAREPVRLYGGRDCQVVLNGINAMNQNYIVASEVLIRGQHADNHPLPGVYTYIEDGYRVDFRVKRTVNDRKHLWAEVYRH